MGMFSISTSVYFGTNSLSELEHLASGRTLVITDPFMVKSGAINAVTKYLEGREYEIFDDVVPDPPIDKVVNGVKRMMQFKPDTVVAVGGGSAIDAAKAIKEFAKRIENSPHIKFIAVPTTSGTGSEVTSFAVITDPSKNIKYPLVSRDLLPDAAILDTELVKTVPPAITADTGMDVLTHAVEAYVSTKANDFSDALCEKAVKLVSEYLIKAYENGKNLEARDKMHNASCLAGMAFDAVSLGINHSIAHNIGGRFHVPHGRCNSILLPHVIEFNAGIDGYVSDTYTDAAKRYSHLAQIIGLPAGSPVIGTRSLINFVKKLQKEMNMPTRLSQCNVGTEEYSAGMDKVAEGAIKDACTLTNPRSSSEGDIKNILTKAF